MVPVTRNKNLETWNLEQSNSRAVEIYTQVERTVRNFKEPATDKTETDQVPIPETVGEDLPF
jgi:hypothetical protein